MKKLLKILKFIANHNLTKNGYIGAIWKFFSWQLLIRLKVIDFVHIKGIAKFNAVKGVVNSSGIYYVSLMEYNEMRALFQYCQKDDVLIDVGANIGTYSIFLSCATGCKSYGFEPDELNYLQLKYNVELNDIDGLVKTYNLALADKPGEIGFESNKGAISHINKNSDKNVQCTSLDYFCSTLEINPTIVKIDVEGFESLVLDGFWEILKSSKKPNVILIELRGHGIKYGYDEELVFDKLLELGYTALHIEFNPTTRYEQINSYSKGDYFFVQDKNNFISRIKSSEEAYKRIFE